MTAREEAPPAASSRLFFALWPSAAVQQTLAAHGRQLASDLGGRMVVASNIHLTLAFLGQTPERCIPDLQDLRARFAQARVTLLIDRIACFDRGLVYAAASQPPAELLRLVEALREALRGLGFAQERREFRPHLTLLRDARKRANARSIDPVAWEVRGIDLVRSQPQRGTMTYERLLGS